MWWLLLLVLGFLLGIIFVLVVEYVIVFHTGSTSDAASGSVDFEDQFPSFNIPIELKNLLVGKSLDSKSVLDQKETCISANIALQFLYQEICDYKTFRRWALRKIQMEFNDLLTKTAVGRLVRDIKVRDLSLGTHFPIIKDVQLHRFELAPDNRQFEEVDFTTSIEYLGGLQISVDVQLVLGGSALLTIQLSRLAGKGRFRLSKHPYTYWAFCYEKDPFMDIKVDSKFQGRPVPQLVRLIVGQFKRILRKRHVLPAYKLRQKPFFINPLMQPSPDPQNFAHIKLIGVLDVCVLRASRLNLVSVPSAHTDIFCTISLGSSCAQPGSHASRIIRILITRRFADEPLGLVMAKESLPSQRTFVDSVSSDSLGSRFGFKVGDIILAVNQLQIVNPKQATRLLSTTTGELAVLVERKADLLGGSDENASSPAPDSNEKMNLADDFVSDDGFVHVEFCETNEDDGFESIAGATEGFAANALGATVNLSNGQRSHSEGDLRGVLQQSGAVAINSSESPSPLEENDVKLMPHSASHANMTSIAATDVERNLSAPATSDERGETDEQDGGSSQTDAASKESSGVHEKPIEDNRNVGAADDRQQAQLNRISFASAAKFDLDSVAEGTCFAKDIFDEFPDSDAPGDVICGAGAGDFQEKEEDFTDCLLDTDSIDNDSVSMQAYGELHGSDQQAMLSKRQRIKAKATAVAAKTTAVAAKTSGSVKSFIERRRRKEPSSVPVEAGYQKLSATLPASRPSCLVPSEASRSDAAMERGSSNTLPGSKSMEFQDAQQRSFGEGQSANLLSEPSDVRWRSLSDADLHAASANAKNADSAVPGGPSPEGTMPSLFQTPNNRTTRSIPIAMLAKNLIEIDETFSFSLAPETRYLNVCVWSALNKKDSSPTTDDSQCKLLATTNLYLPEILDDCSLTLSHCHQEKFPLRASGTAVPPKEFDKLKQHGGFDARLCYGDVTMRFAWRPDDVLMPASAGADSVGGRIPVSAASGSNAKSLQHARDASPAGQGPFPEASSLSAASATHRWEEVHFQSATVCSVCNKKIWLKSALQCRDCGIKSHRKYCSVSVQTACTKSRARTASVGDTGNQSAEESDGQSTGGGTSATSASTGHAPIPVSKATNVHDTDEPLLSSSPHTTQHANVKRLYLGLTDKFSEIRRRKKTSADSGPAVEELIAAVKAVPSGSFSLPTSPLTNEEAAGIIADAESVGSSESLESSVHCGGLIFKQGGTYNEHIINAAKDLGKELFADLPLAQRKAKIDEQIDKLKMEIDEASKRRLELAKESQREPDLAKKREMQKKLDNMDEKIQAVAVLMLHYCAGLQHCCDLQEELGISDEQLSHDLTAATSDRVTDVELAKPES